MQPRPIARGRRSDTHLISFNTTNDSFIAALAFASTSIAHILCKRPTVERIKRINVSHLFIRWLLR